MRARNQDRHGNEFVMIADHPLSSSQRGPMANNSDKWSVLAVTRFLLATCVLITHSGVVAPGTRIFAYLGHTGYPAVFAFFMISGYSIAHSITVSPRGYVWRRAKRIFPSYVAALALSAVVALPGPLPLPTGQLIPAPTVMDILGNLFMMQGILCDTIVTDGPLWSISIEWWLYMTAPVLALFTYRAAAVCAFVSFAGLVAYYWVNGYVQVLPYGWNPLLLGWSWFAGFAFYHKRSLVTFLLLVLPPLILFDIYIRLDFGPAIVGVTAATILFADSVKVHRWARP